MKDNQKPNNPPAFPQIKTDAARNSNMQVYSNTYSEGGLTLRDYFAAKVMAAIYANSTVKTSLNYGKTIHPETVARNSYDMADAMLKERSKDENS